MRLGISNLAWQREDDEVILELLKYFKIDAVDVAPGKYFSDFEATTRPQLNAVRRWWEQRGIEITGMQSLLFGTQGLNVFGTTVVQRKLLNHMRSVCRLGEGLGARRLVFGSPKNRDRSGLSDEQTMDRAVSFFRKLGDVAREYGVWVCLEPNPLRYGANFMTNSTETLEVVRAVDHPSIRLQIDSGAMAVNGEDYAAELRKGALVCGHVHISEPDLVPIGDGRTDHAAFVDALDERLPGSLVTIEMLATSQEPASVSVGRALKFAREYYS